MSKTITSPVKRFPGEITLPDYLTFPQATAWEQSQMAANKLRENTDATGAEYLAAWQPGITACVESWNLTGYDPTNPPATPRTSVINLIAWLITEITKLYEEAEEVPNE